MPPLNPRTSFSNGKSNLNQGHQPIRQSISALVSTTYKFSGFQCWNVWSHTFVLHWFWKKTRNHALLSVIFVTSCTRPMIFWMGDSVCKHKLPLFGRTRRPNLFTQYDVGAVQWGVSITLEGGQYIIGLVHHRVSRSTLGAIESTLEGLNTFVSFHGVHRRVLSAFVSFHGVHQGDIKVHCSEQCPLLNSLQCIPDSLPQTIIIAYQ